MINVIVCGAAGRMGKRVCALILESDDLKLVGGTETSGNPNVYEDIGIAAGVGKVETLITDNLHAFISENDVIIDFTTPEATLKNAEVTAKLGKALVVGTTGLSDKQKAQFKKIVAPIPCVFAPNYSVGVNLFLKQVKDLARILGPAYNVEVIEKHHKRKADAPSGTAIALGKAAARGMGWNFDEVAVYGRQGKTGERPEQQIGIHAIRGGTIAGEHTVLFAGEAEEMELTHRAESRDVFAMGALRAVRWVVDQSPGLYDMQDVLGLK